MGHDPLDCRTPAEAVFDVPSEARALEAAREAVERWSASHHSAVAEWIDESIEDALACFAFPEPQRRRIRATDGLERFDQEMERRTRAVRIFSSANACQRLATSFAAGQSEEWLSGRRYLDTGLLDETAAPGSADRPNPEGEHKEAQPMAATTVDEDLTRGSYTSTSTRL